jgi:site-specific DNA recombinase
MDKSYFLYARKSTDVEDKQVLSIEAQLVELRALAKQNGLRIAEEFVEKRSAKLPDRPIFNEMLARIEQGEARGILCWKIDRLSRNPMDSGKVSWLLQRKVIECITTHERTFYPTDNVLMMSVEFGMANEYVRQLSANTARGLRQKARNGHYPSVAPLGYLNDPRTKTIAVDRRKAPVVVHAFELYAENKSRLEDVSRFLFESGVKTRATKRWAQGGDRPWKRDQVSAMLSNSFYYGHFRYAGEIYEGKHKPLISKELFDKVQRVLQLRGKSKREKNEPQALCGLLSCGECGCSITAETQKGHVYYRCTKKRVPCSQPFIREEALDAQLSALLSRYVLPPDWATELLRMATEDEKDAHTTASASVQALRARLAELDGKLARLTDLYVEQDIERDAYLERKRALMSEKRSAQEQVLLLERNAAAWLEPLREWILDAQTLDEIRNTNDLSSKKSSLQKIFGSNLTLQSREAHGVAGNPWFSLAHAKENASEKNLISCLVPGEGLEPSHLAIHDFESCASTNSAIPACVPSYFNIGAF